MPTISAFYGILIQMFWSDHAPPHFHALYAEYEVLIDIHTLELVSSRGRKPHRKRPWGAMEQPTDLRLFCRS